MGLVCVPLGLSDGFVPPPLFTGTRLGWCVDADGLAEFAVDRPVRLGSARRRVPLDGSEFESVVRERVLPFLEQFSTVADALAYGRRVIAHWRASAAIRNVPADMRESPGDMEAADRDRGLGGMARCRFANDAHHREPSRRRPRARRKSTTRRPSSGTKTTTWRMHASNEGRRSSTPRTSR